MPASERIARLLVVPLVVLFVFLLLSDAGGSDVDPVTTSSGDDAISTTTRPYFGASSPTTGAPTTPTTGGRTSTSTSTSAAEPDLPGADPEAEPVEAVGTYEDGTVVLRGSVPDAATATGYRRRLAAALGEGAVTSELALDDRTTAETLRIDVARPFASPEDGTFDPALAPLAEVAARVLAQLPESSLVVTGHTDAVGTEATDRALSVARARLVVGHLVEQGVPAGRTIADGVGYAEPVASDDTEAGRAANRRITVAFVGIAPTDG
jgi:flagellar motor protein MotB